MDDNFICAQSEDIRLNVLSIETILVDLLSLKQLTIKTLDLIAITSDRGQALHLKNIKKIHIFYAGISFIITYKLPSKS